MYYLFRIFTEFNNKYFFNVRWLKIFSKKLETKNDLS